MGGTELKQEKNYDKDNNSEYPKDLIYMGKFSDIYKSKNDNGDTIAIKIINKNKLKSILNDINEEELEKYIDDKLKKIKICQKGSEYVIKFFNEVNKSSEFYIEMEYCNSNLKSYLRKNNKGKGMDIHKIKDLFTKINKTLIIMKKNNIVHGNINPEHILIDDSDENNIIPKLSDYFNFSSIIHQNSLYTAPEIITNQNIVDIKSDLWSIGLILYELYFNNIPFDSKEKMMKAIRNNDLNILKCNKDKYFDDLIQKLLKINIEERISFNEYINHKFWKQAYSKEESENEENKDKNSNDNKSNNYQDSNEVVFKFNTTNYKEEMKNFSNKKLENIQIFKFVSADSNKTNLDDEYIINWLMKINFKKLIKLDISGNNIQKIDGISKCHLDNLKELSLNSNLISDINELLKLKTKNLTSLDLSENKIYNINGLTNINFKNITILNLSENKINDITPLINCTFNKITILNLGFNEIKNIDMFSKVNFTDLNILYLNNNQIELIDVFNFVPFDKLEILNLSSNKIKIIESLKDCKLKMLKKLNLSFNRIVDIGVINSLPLTNLECFNLSFNKITKIEPLENLKLKSLKKITIYGNKEIDSKFNKNMEKDLSKNKIILF